MEIFLQSMHPRIYRIALALCGDRRVAESLVDHVLRRSMSISSRWKTEADGVRWCTHYTVLTSRRFSNSTESPPDPLLAASDDFNWRALMGTLRRLPMQQREAFLLHHGELLDLRQLSTAMDCSSEAAANHLVAAVTALRQVPDAMVGDFTRALPMALKRLAPPHADLDLQVTRAIRRHRRRRWFLVWILGPIELLLIAGVAWELWRFWKMIEF